MKKIASVFTAGVLFLSGSSIALAYHHETPLAQKVDHAPRPNVRRMMKKGVRRSLQGSLLETVQERIKNKPKDRDALKGKMEAGSYRGLMHGIKKGILRHKLSGDTLHCVQVAEKSGMVNKNCERLKDWRNLLDNCAKDMSFSEHCMKVERQVIEWQKIQSAKTSASATSTSASSTSSISSSSSSQ